MLGELRVEDFGVGEVSKPLRSLAETCAGNANFFPWAPNVEVGVRYILLGDSIPTGEDAGLWRCVCAEFVLASSRAHCAAPL